MAPAPKTILVIAGDPSGDLHGAHLIKELKGHGFRVAAVGGPLIRKEADEFIEDLAARGMTGFLEPFKALPFFFRLARRLRDFMLKNRPAALVCIDYYGFNRRVLAIAKACGVPAYYYISPQVWASRAGRIKTLKDLIRRMFVIFPFEEKIYAKEKVPCLFVGHPLLDLLPAARRDGGLKAPLKVGLLPGSRASEIKRHLPLFLKAFEELKRHFPDSKAFVFASSSLPDRAYAAAGHRFELVRESGYQSRKTLDIAISSSGTATLENALLGIPMVVVYKLSWATYAIARAIIKVPYISMANILAGRLLVPELIQNDATPQKIARAAVSLLENPEKLAALKKDLAGLRGVLGSAGAAQTTARAIAAELAS